MNGGAGPHHAVNERCTVTCRWQPARLNGRLGSGVWVRWIETLVFGGDRSWTAASHHTAVCTHLSGEWPFRPISCRWPYH